MFSSTPVIDKYTSPVLMTLPNELLAVIASYCTIWHSTADHAIDVKSTAALSLVSRRLRENALPFLLSDVVLKSGAQLEALSKLPVELLRLVREVNVFMDPDFFAAFKTFAPLPPSTLSPYTYLGAILSQTSALSALRIRVAESTGDRSPWTRPFLVRPDGIPVGLALKHALTSVPPLIHLRYIELDAFSDIAPLMRLTPNLAHLSMNNPSGYAQYTNTELLVALQYVSRLRSLVYSAESLRVNTSPPGTDTVEYERAELETEEESGSAGLVEAVGNLLPGLERLDLQVRWYGDEVLFPFCEEVVDPEALVRAARRLGSMKHLALPTTTISRKEFSFIRDADPVARGSALHCAEVSEVSTALAVSQVAQHLKSISFVRPTSVSHRIDSSIQYILNGDGGIQERQMCDAKVGQSDPLPYVESAPTWGFQWFRSAALEYAKENKMTAVIAASMGGALLGEAGRALYGRRLPNLDSVLSAT